MNLYNDLWIKSNFEKKDEQKEKNEKKRLIFLKENRIM